MSARRIRNWSKWQSYRADRGQPPWIKIHREVMRNVEWVSLTDAQRGQLVAIWLLAADHDGVIPASPSIIQKLCFLDTPPDLELFTEQGFIEPDANVTPPRRQPDADMTHQRQSRGREETEKTATTELPSAKANGADPDSENPADFIFGAGLRLLTSAGNSEPSARAFLGKLRKQAGDSEVAAAVLRACEQKPSDPKAWLHAACVPKPRGVVV